MLVRVDASVNHLRKVSVADCQILLSSSILLGLSGGVLCDVLDATIPDACHTPNHLCAMLVTWMIWDVNDLQLPSLSMLISTS